MSVHLSTPSTTQEKLDNFKVRRAFAKMDMSIAALGRAVGLSNPVMSHWFAGDRDIKGRALEAAKAICPGWAEVVP